MNNSRQEVPSVDRLDRIIWPCRRHDEPEEHVHHIHDPDRSVQVQTVAEEQFPQVRGLDGLVLGRPDD